MKTTVKVGQVWDMYGRLLLVLRPIDLGPPWEADAMWQVVDLETAATSELAALSFGMPRDVLLHDPS